MGLFDPFYIIKGYLPVDIFVEIAVRMPVRAILRCRKVGKQWRTLFDHPSFIKNHLEKVTAESANVVRMIVGEDDSGIVYDVTIDMENPTSTSVAQLEWVDSFSRNICIVSSCRGLVCLHEPSSYKTIILNPSTRNQFSLPSPKSNSTRYSYVDSIFGFGYDGEDFKLMEVVFGYNWESCSPTYDVRLFSLMAETWKDVDIFPESFRFQNINGVYVGGSLHFVGSEEGEEGDIILAFDLGSESCRKVPLPHLLIENFVLHALSDGLAMVTKNSNSVWLMTGDSWVKLFSFTLQTPFSRITPIFKRCNMVLLHEENSSLFWVNTSNYQVTRVMGIHLPQLSGAVPYIESLIPVRMLQDEDKQSKKKEKYQ